MSIGFFYRSKFLDSNKCLMTFTNRDKENIPVQSNLKLVGAKLYKYNTPKANGQKKNKSLNPIPVLFIPGHLGK